MCNCEGPGRVRDPKRVRGPRAFAGPDEHDRPPNVAAFWKPVNKYVFLFRPGPPPDLPKIGRNWRPRAPQRTAQRSNLELQIQNIVQKSAMQTNPQMWEGKTPSTFLDVFGGRSAQVSPPTHSIAGSAPVENWAIPVVKCLLCRHSGGSGRHPGCKYQQPCLAPVAPRVSGK
jgi:hypothetical protein